MKQGHQTGKTRGHLEMFIQQVFKSLIALKMKWILESPREILKPEDVWFHFATVNQLLIDESWT